MTEAEVNPAEGQPAGQDAEPQPVARPAGRFGLAAGLVVVALSILVAGFAPLSWLVARDLPRPPVGFAPVATGRQLAGTTAVRDVPVGLPRTARIRTTTDVLPYAVAALGPSPARQLIKILNSSAELSATPVGYSSGSVVYPYHYPALDAVLSQAPAANFAAHGTALGAALEVLATQSIALEPACCRDSFMALENATPAAFAVLNRARAASGCPAQLDLFLMLTADPYTSASGGILAREQRRTGSACPHDPTSGWLAGQRQLRMMDDGDTATLSNTDTLQMLASAIGTFRHLSAEFPKDTAITTGLGDAYLRAGTHLRLSKPFTARQDFRSAIAEYNRASTLGNKRDAAPGVARALIGLGQPAKAARLLHNAVGATKHPAALLEVMIMAEESAHNFSAAETAARRLSDLGLSAYPDSNALFPLPAVESVDALDDATLPLSFGAERLKRFAANLVAAGGAGAYAQDLSFIPQYRDDPGTTGMQPSCPSWTWRRDALLDGHITAVLTGWPSEFSGLNPANTACFQSDKLKLIAEAAAGRKPDTSSYSGDEITDAWQNLLRWAGNLRQAEKLTRRWQSARGDTDMLPALRLGEIEFLTHHYNDAAAEFALAARRSRLSDESDDLAAWQAQLDQGAALLAAGRAAEGVQLLRPLDIWGTQGYAYQKSRDQEGALQFAAVSYYADELLADHERETGDLHAAAEDYTTALDWAPQLEQGSGARPEVLNNNAALAYLALGDTSTATHLENKALATDPKDPIFLMTDGFIADRAAHIVQAQRYDRATLESDPGAFPAANDLGVELGRQHRYQASVSFLRQAVGASPGYALGWFNLGVAESALGPSHILAAQGAFATAYSLDPALKNRRPVLTIDAKVYRTALDLSKPLPPLWSFAQLQKPAPAVAVGLVAIAVLGFGLARTSGQGGNDIAANMLEKVSGQLERAPLLRRLRHAAWGVAATGATFMLAYLRQGPNPAEFATYIFGVLVLAVIPVAARSVLARRSDSDISQTSWPPAIAFGLVTGAFGLPWAPLPVVTSSESKPRLHLVAPGLLAALSLLLFAESAWLHTPITQAWAIAALIMAASTLIPVGPLDGARVGKAGIVPAAGLATGALLVAMGLI